MKKFFAVLILSVLFLSVNAQEPGNNLGKSIAQIQSSFPNLRYLREEKGYQIGLISKELYEQTLRKKEMIEKSIPAFKALIKEYKK